MTRSFLMPALDKPLLCVDQSVPPDAVFSATSGGASLLHIHDVLPARPSCWLTFGKPTHVCFKQHIYDCVATRIFFSHLISITKRLFTFDRGTSTRRDELTYKGGTYFIKIKDQ